MTPPIITPKSRPRRLWLFVPLAFLMFVLVVMLSIGVLAVGVVRSFGLSSDAAQLRDGVMKSAKSEWHKEIEVGVGAVVVNLARTALCFVPIDPQARTALRAFRGGEVGVYQRRNRQHPINDAALLDAADRAMTSRGWDRVVGVRNQNELVAIYAPRRLHSPRTVKICLMVVNEQQLVIASARGNLQPLLELAQGRPEWRHPLRELVQR